jgi:hypothetical protein
LYSKVPDELNMQIIDHIPEVLLEIYSLLFNDFLYIVLEFRRENAIGVLIPISVLGVQDEFVHKFIIFMQKGVISSDFILIFIIGIFLFLFFSDHVL